MKRIIIAAAAAALTAVQVVAAEPFRDANLPPRQRATDLASRMTLDEKMALLSGYNDFFYIHVSASACRLLKWPMARLA